MANEKNNFDDILSSILDKSSDEQQDSNRDGIIAEPESYSEVLGKYSVEADLDDDLSATLVSEHTNVFQADRFKQKTPAFEPSEYEQPEPKPKHNRPRRNYSAYVGVVLATLVVCLSILISLFGIVVGRDFLGIDGSDNEFIIYIPEGSSVDDIANQLYDEGVIDYVNVFKAYVKISGSENMYPGDLEITGSMSYSDLIEALTEMRESKETVTVTFVEGITLYDAAQLLEENGVCDSDDFIYTFNTTIFGYDFENYVTSSTLKFYKYEGYLFPDTYEFYVGDTTYNIVKRIKQRTNEILNADVISRASELGYSIDEVVTLASIVQRESGDAEQMKNVASVFLNRLANPESYPKLQSDTTYSYINLIKSLVTVEYDQMYNAYDTYTCTGLPVGPICNPGLDAINAVLYANDTDYYYFCSNLETREMFYAQTYDEHKSNLKAAGLEV